MENGESKIPLPDFFLDGPDCFKNMSDESKRRAYERYQQLLREILEKQDSELGRYIRSIGIDKV